MPSLCTSSTVTRRTWASTKTGVLWPLGLLPDVLGRVRTLMYGYNATITNYSSVGDTVSKLGWARHVSPLISRQRSPVALGYPLP